MDLASGGGQRTVVWIGLPPERPDRLNQAKDTFNAAAREQAAIRPTCTMSTSYHARRSRRQLQRHGHAAGRFDRQRSATVTACTSATTAPTSSCPLLWDDVRAGVASDRLRSSAVASCVVTLPRLSPTVYQRVTLFALVALGVIVVTGGAVRLTGSGLGCPQWPNCDAGHLAPHGETGYHGGGRVREPDLHRARLGRGHPRRARLVLPRATRGATSPGSSFGLVVGVLAQIVLGGLTVIYGLSPPWVMAHFLLSIVLLADAVVLHVRAGASRRRPAHTVVDARGARHGLGRGRVTAVVLVHRARS